jgi:hypothetical protein
MGRYRNPAYHSTTGVTLVDALGWLVGGLVSSAGCPIPLPKG